MRNRHILSLLLALAALPVAGRADDPKPSPKPSSTPAAAATHKSAPAKKKVVHRKPVAKAPAKEPVKVWVNTASGVYHYPGQRWYGATKEGEYMTEADARKRGFMPTSNGQ